MSFDQFTLVEYINPETSNVAMSDMVSKKVDFDRLKDVIRSTPTEPSNDTTEVADEEESSYPFEEHDIDPNSIYEEESEELPDEHHKRLEHHLSSRDYHPDYHHPRYAREYPPHSYYEHHYRTPPRHHRPPYDYYPHHYHSSYSNHYRSPYPYPSPHHPHMHYVPSRYSNPPPASYYQHQRVTSPPRVVTNPPPASPPRHRYVSPPARSDYYEQRPRQDNRSKRQASPPLKDYYQRPTFSRTPQSINKVPRRAPSPSPPPPPQPHHPSPHHPSPHHPSPHHPSPKIDRLPKRHFPPQPSSSPRPIENSPVLEPPSLPTRPPSPFTHHAPSLNSEPSIYENSMNLIPPTLSMNGPSTTFPPNLMSDSSTPLLSMNSNTSFLDDTDAIDLVDEDLFESSNKGNIEEDKKKAGFLYWLHYPGLENLLKKDDSEDQSKTDVPYELRPRKSTPKKNSVLPKKPLFAENEVILGSIQINTINKLYEEASKGRIKTPSVKFRRGHTKPIPESMAKSYLERVNQLRNHLGVENWPDHMS